MDTMIPGTTPTEHQLEQARRIAVELEAENALVASLVRAQNERGLLDTSHTHLARGNRHGCPTCQLVAWAASA